MGERVVWYWNFTGTISALAAVVLLGACSASPIQPQRVVDDGGRQSGSKLSAERINAIRERYLGQYFVLREDWYEYAWIDTDPEGGFGEPTPRTKFPYGIKARSHVRLVAPAGTIARITGVNSRAPQVLTFIAQTLDGQEFYPRLLARRPRTVMFGARNSSERVSRVRMDDDDFTMEKITYWLTHHTMEFVEAPPERTSAIASQSEPSELTVTTPTIAALSVEAAPSHVLPGEEVELALQFEVSAPQDATVNVRERRTLSFNGKVLPSYPVESAKVRGGGSFATSVSQTIPAGASEGVYEYRGEVCVLADCIDKRTRFEVLR